MAQLAHEVIAGWSCGGLRRRETGSAGTRGAEAEGRPGACLGTSGSCTGHVYACVRLCVAHRPIDPPPSSWGSGPCTYLCIWTRVAAGRLECLGLAGLGSPPEGVLSASR